MASGVALARAMAMLTYRTPDEFADRFGEAPIIRNSIVRVASEVSGPVIHVYVRTDERVN